MITFVSPNPSRHGYLAMPISGCADAARLRALPEFMGWVSPLGTAVKGDVRLVATDVYTRAGTSAWSPPT